MIGLSVRLNGARGIVAALEATDAMIADDWTLTDAGVQTSREGFGTLVVTIDTVARPGIIAVRWTDQAGKDPVNDFGAGVEPTTSLGGGVFQLTSTTDEFGALQKWHESTAGALRSGIRIFVLEANKTWSEVSADTKSATPTTVPSAPTVGTITLAATGTPNELEISLSGAPATGGSAITGYQVQVDGGAWTTLAGDPTSAAQTFTAASGDERNVRIRALNANGAGWESVTVTATPTVSLWQPSEITDLIAWDATDASTITRVNPGTDESVTDWVSKIGTSVNLDDSATARSGSALYDSVDQTVEGNNSQIPLIGTLPYNLGGALAGLTFAFAIKPLNDGSGRAWVGSTNGFLNVNPDTVFGSTSGNFTPLRNSTDARIVVITGERDSVDSRIRKVYIDGELITTNTSATGLTTATNILRLLGISFYASSANNATASLQWFACIPSVLSKDDRQKLEGWMKANLPLVASNTLTDEDGIGAHPFNSSAPGADAPAFTIDNAVPETTSTNTAISGVVGDWTATLTGDGTLRAAKRADVTALAYYRLTADVTAPVGEHVALRVGRDALLWQDEIPNDFQDFTDEFVAERMVIGTGSPVSVTLDFLAPRTVLYFGVVRPNVVGGLAVTVENLALVEAPETVAIGSTTTASAIEHDGVIFRLRHSVSGDPVTVGRFPADGQYWALNDDPLDPVEVWQTEVVGRGTGMLDVVHDSYSEWGTLTGQTQTFATDQRAAVEGGCMIDTFWQREDLPGASFSVHQGQSFTRRFATSGFGSTGEFFVSPPATAPGLACYFEPSNVEPSRTGKPIVFDGAGADFTEESDRISAPEESTLIKQVPNDLQLDVQGRARTSHFVTLTVVTTTPGTNDFRPCSVRRGNKASVGATTAINMARVPSLTLDASIQSSLPPVSEIIYRLRRPMPANSSVIPIAMWLWPVSWGGAYPRELTQSIPEIFYTLVSDQTSSDDRQTIMRLITQHAIDIAGFVADGANNPCSPDGEAIGIYAPILMAGAGASQLSWITDNCDGSILRLPETTGIGRTPQAWIDREVPAYIPRSAAFNEKNVTPSFSAASLGQPLYTERSTDGNALVAFGASPYFADAKASAGAGSPYRKQNESGFGAVAEIAGSIGAAGFLGRDYWGESSTFELWRTARAVELILAPTLINGDAMQADEIAFFAAFGDSAGPVTAATWGLEYIARLGSSGVSNDAVGVIRPCYPSDTGVWLDVSEYEFCGALLTSPASLTYSVLGATTFGEVTTSALPSGFSLNTSTGEISVNGTQTAGSLLWVAIRATDGSARTADTCIAIHVAEAYLRALWCTDNEPSQMKFRAEVQSETGLGGTLYWILYGGEDAPSRVTRRLFTRPTPAEIKTGTYSGETVVSAGSVAVAANGFTNEFSPSSMAALKVYGLSVYFEPDTETPPDPIHMSYVTQAT